MDLGGFPGRITIQGGIYHVLPAETAAAETEIGLQAGWLGSEWDTIRYYRKLGVEVARRLGYSTSATSHATKRGRKIVEEDEALRQCLDIICK